MRCVGTHDGAGLGWGLRPELPRLSLVARSLSRESLWKQNRELTVTVDTAEEEGPRLCRGMSERGPERQQTRGLQEVSYVATESTNFKMPGK